MAATKRQTYLEYGLMLIAVVALMHLVTTLPVFDYPPQEGTLNKVLLWVGILVAGFLAIALHELGHLLAGLAQGFRLQLFVVGPLGIKREDGRVKWYLNTNLGHYGGLAATMPRDNDPTNARKFARLLLAGPLTSLLLGGLLLWLSTYLGNLWNTLVMITGAISIGLFFATTIPSRTGMLFTDRKRYQRLTQAGPARETELAMIRIMGQYAADDSYARVADADIDRLIADEEPFLSYYGWFNKLYKSLEQGREPAEEDWNAFHALGEGMSKSVHASMVKMLEEAKEK